MIPKLHQYQLDNNVTAFSTMRSCDENSLQAEGKVNDAYASFNINPWVGDNEEQVKNNRLELAKALEINEKNIILPHQTHQTEVRQIASEFSFIALFGSNNAVRGSRCTHNQRTKRVHWRFNCRLRACYNV